MERTPRTAIDFPYLHGGMVAEIASGRPRSHAEIRSSSGYRCQQSKQAPYLLTT